MVSVENGTKYCFKDSTSIRNTSEILTTECACFKTGIISVDWKLSVHNIIK